MRVKWNRQLDGSLSRRQLEEENNQEGNKDKGCKPKDSPKLFRLFRKKKQKAPVPPGSLSGAPYPPSEVDEDDCASISSVVTVASQPTAEVCHRDRTLSIFSSFRLSFPGGRKKSKRIVASAADTDPLYHQGKKEPENSRYSSPDLRRERLDESCGQLELSKSSPSVKDTIPERVQKENSEYFNQRKHSSTNCIEQGVNVAEKLNDDQTKLSKSSPSVKDPDTDHGQNCKPFNHLKQRTSKCTRMVARNKLDDDHMELPKSSPSVESSITDLGQNDTFNPRKQSNSKSVQQEAKPARENFDCRPRELCQSLSIVPDPVTVLRQNGCVFKESMTAADKLNAGQMKLFRSSVSVKENTLHNLQALKQLRTENCNLLNQLKHDDANSCARQNMSSEKSVSFCQRSLSPNDVTSVETGVSPTVNGMIEEDPERKLPAHLVEPSCRGKSTPDDPLEIFQTISDPKRIGNSMLCVVPNSSGNCDKKSDLSDKNVKKCDLHEDCNERVCSDNFNCLDDKYVQFCGQICDTNKCNLQDKDGEVCAEDLKLSSISDECWKNSGGACNRSAFCESMFPEEVCNDVSATLKSYPGSCVNTITNCLDIKSETTVNSGLSESMIPEYETCSKEDDTLSSRYELHITNNENCGNISNIGSLLKNGEICNMGNNLNQTVPFVYSAAENLDVNYGFLSSADNPTVENFKLSCSDFEILGSNCVPISAQNTQLPMEYSECHNHDKLYTLNNETEFSSVNSVMKENINAFSLEEIPQFLNNSNTDYSNICDDYFVLLKLFPAGDSVSEFYPCPLVRKRSVLNFNSPYMHPDNINGLNTLSDVESYLHKLTEAEVFPSSCPDTNSQLKSVIVWNVSLVQNIISCHFPTKTWRQIDFNNSKSRGDSSLVTTIRGKNQIVVEDGDRCPAAPFASTPPGPSPVTVPNHDLHTDTPQYIDRSGRSHLLEDTMLSNVGTTSLNLFRNIPNGDMYIDDGIAGDYGDGEIYEDEHIISIGRCEGYLTLDENCSVSVDSSEGYYVSGKQCLQAELKSTEEGGVSKQKYSSESKLGSSEINNVSGQRYSESTSVFSDTYIISGQNCSESELGSCEEYGSSVQLQDNSDVGVKYSTLNGCVGEYSEDHLPTSEVTDTNMCINFSKCTRLLDSLPEDNGSSGYVTLSDGFSCDHGVDHSNRDCFIQYEDTPNCAITEIKNNYNDVDNDMVYEGVKEKIKIFECGSADVSIESTATKTASVSTGHLEQSPKSKTSMIPSLRKGIPTAVIETNLRSTRGKSPNKRDRAKGIPGMVSRKSQNARQAQTTNTPTEKNSSSSLFKVNDEHLHLKSHFKHLKNFSGDSNIVIDSDLCSVSCPVTENSSTIPEISERSKSEEFLLDTASQMQVPNPKSQNRRHSSATVSELPTTHFAQISHKSDPNTDSLDCGDSDSSVIAPSDGKCSNLTLDEISISVYDSSSAIIAGPQVAKNRGLQARCASLPLVVGQVQAPTRRNCLSKDTPRGSSRIPRKQTGGRGSHLTSKPVRPPMWLSKAELTQEIQQLGNLCEARTKELNRLKMETKHVTVGFDAFAALFKYMVEDLNGLSVPMLSEDLGKTLKQLELAKQDLAYYEREVEEMKAHHCQELNDLSNKLFEVFQGEVTELGSKHQEEINRLKLDHEQQIKATTETFKASCEDTQAAHEAVVMRLQQELISQREELQLFHENELVELEEKYSQSTKTLHEHIEQLQKKCAELKHHSMGMEDAMRKDTDTKLQWVTSRKGDLEKEVESLKAVLEMKNKELHTLRVQNLEMEKQLEELPLAREKIKMLSARAEDLEALMIEKTKLERKLSTENQVIKDTYEKESKVNKRLSMENEELQWRLRQAEHSLLSGSFSEVLEYPEDAENGAISPVKSPPQMSRSVFFTYVDKEDTSSPRSQYKKITPGFSSGYKTSPSKSSKSPPAPSPRRGRGQSEPIQPPCSTPKKSGKTISLKQKRQRATTDSGSVQSFAGSMASSVGSECSVFDQKEGLLEEHKEQIIESLEILREQRFSEENDSEPIPPNDSELPTPNDIDSKWLEDTTKQHGQSVSFEGDQVMKSLDIFHEKRSPGENDGEPITPNEKWQDDVKHNGERLTFAVDEMSRSSEFSDPKTYYHMTFPVLKDAGSPGCDTEDIRKVENHNGIVAQPTHSIEGSNVIHMSEKVSLEATNVSSQEGATTKVESEEVAQHAFVSCHNVRDLEYNGQSREKNRWRTM